FHFSRPGDPKVQAGRFLRNIGDAKGLRLALDHEDPNVTMTNARIFMETVKNEIGYYPHYYSFQSFILDRENQMDPGFWKKTKLWLAAYNNSPKWPKGIWEDPDMWQFTGDGNGPLPHQVPGIQIAGGCDINVVHD